MTIVVETIVVWSGTNPDPELLGVDPAGPGWVQPVRGLPEGFGIVLDRKQASQVDRGFNPRDHAWGNCG